MLGSLPLERTEEDKLGLGSLAKHLAKSFRTLDNKNGYIFGIEGPWGSGKTSLANMALNELRNQANFPAIIVNFSPWEISPEEDIVHYFFGEMSKQITEFIEASNETGKIIKEEAATLAQDLRRFGQKLAPIGKIASVAAEYGIPLASTADGFLKAISVLSEEKDKSLRQRKDEMTKKMAACGAKFFVLIDDLDRLEPKQIEQIIRLVRAVADFPNVTYILCYDKGVVSSAIEKCLLIDDGSKFLEKIVQFELPVPSPEDFALRRLFRERLSDVVGVVSDRAASELHLVIERWGGRYLSTPRSVDKVVDSITFTLLNEDLKLYIPDLVLIKLIQHGNRKYYEFIQKYLTAWSAIKISRGTADEGAKRRLLEEMRGALESDESNFALELIWMDDFLPGIQHYDLNKEDASPLLNPQIGIPEAGRLGRLSSPDHYRLYFASEYPSDAPDQKDIHAVLRSFREAKGLKTTTTRILRSKGASALEAILSRIRKDWSGWLNDRSGQHAFRVFSQVGDDKAITSEIDGLFGQPGVWMESRWFLEAFKPRSLQLSEVESVFRSGRAVGWLTSVARAETFSHGRYGNQREPEREWIFTEAQLDRALSGLNRRYKTLSLKEMVEIPVSNNVFFAWAQGGFAEEANSYVIRKTRRNSDFVLFLESFWTGSSGSLKFKDREGAAGLFDYEKFRARLTRLSSRRDKLGLRAKALIPKFTSGPLGTDEGEGEE